MKLLIKFPTRGRKDKFFLTLEISRPIVKTLTIQCF
jgi:hypothetical protein